MDAVRFWTTRARGKDWPRKLFKIGGATHIETYWVTEYVDGPVTECRETVEKLTRR